MSRDENSTIVAVCACLAAGASPTAASSAPYTVIDVIHPAVPGGAHRDGDRMRGARERLKDIVPGGRLAYFARPSATAAATLGLGAWSGSASDRLSSGSRVGLALEWIDGLAVGTFLEPHGRQPLLEDFFGLFLVGLHGRLRFFVLKRFAGVETQSRRQERRRAYTARCVGSNRSSAGTPRQRANACLNLLRQA